MLHTLRDRLPVVEAVHLGSQLPMLIRGFYYEGWSPLDKPLKFTRDEFLMTVGTYFRGDPEVSGVPVTRAVVETLAAHIDPGELNKLVHVLPRDFADLLHAPARRAWAFLRAPRSRRIGAPLCVARSCAAVRFDRGEVPAAGRIGRRRQRGGACITDQREPGAVRRQGDGPAGDRVFAGERHGPGDDGTRRRRPIFGLIIGLVSCFQGIKTQGGTEGVGRSATSSVLRSSLFLILTDVVLVRLILTIWPM